MTWLMAMLFGRLPIGWLQLTHNRPRLVAAVAGIAFANLLVFVQLGVVASMSSVVALTYTPFRADLLISPPRDQLFSDALMTRRVMYLAQADECVADAAPLYLGNIDWKQKEGASKGLLAYGLAPEAGMFVGETISPQSLALMSLPDRVLLDDQFRNPDPGTGAEAETAVLPTVERPFGFEINGHAVDAVGSFRLGSGFGYDGALFMSDQTFLRLMPGQSAGTPSHILLDLKPGCVAEEVATRLATRLAAEGVQIRTTRQAIADDVAYMNTEAPMGIIFGAGVFIGVFVGLVIVYQILSTDVAAHLKEYATFKAMGYSHRFLLGIVLEEAMIIALLGFVPGALLGSGVYLLMGSATGLPLTMTGGRAIAVLLGTFAACVVSGMFATLRLRQAEPAELF